MQQDAFSPLELASVMNISRQAISKRANREQWPSRKRSGRGGGTEFLFSDLPDDIRAAVICTEVSCNNPAPLKTKRKSIPIDAKRKAKAAAKLDLVNLYLEWLARNGRSTQSRNDFISAYKVGQWPHLLEAIGPKVSWKSIERWKVTMNTARDLSAIADKRGIARKGQRNLDEVQKNALIRFLMRPGEPTVASAFRAANKALAFEGYQQIGSQSQAYRYIREDFMPFHFGEWTFTRKGVKAWNDQCAFFIERDYSLIEVGDIIVADGHKLNFEIVNPWTGKAQRMELVLWFDMKSNFPLGWEIMPSEDTQAIAAALRRACMVLGKYPKVAYLDNGRAFRSKYFNDTDLRQTGVGGLFYSLGIQTLFAWPYHGQSKTVERFFGTFAELERWVPSYSGTSIEKKPPRMLRGERIHRAIYEQAGGRPLTLLEAHYAVALFFDEYIQRPQKGHLKGQSPVEVFTQGRGPGLDETELERLKDLMLHKELRTINRNGVSLFGKNYYSPELYSRKHAVLVKYDPQAYDQHGELAYVLVYDQMGNFICRADKVCGIHPAARILGDEQHQAELKTVINLKKHQEKSAANVAKTMLESVVIPETQARMRTIEVQTEQGQLPIAKPAPLPAPSIERIEAAKEKARQQMAERSAYTPPEDKTEILTEFDRYKYLLGISERDGITLTDNDQEWMRTYEDTDEYKRFTHKRFDLLRSVYARQVRAADNG
jgi:Mu transposase, C-terminal./Mu DNA-binding domain./Integrase core domain.